MHAQSRMGQGLGALLAPSRRHRERAAASVPFVEVAACVADAIEHRLRCIPNASQSDLFDAALSSRPTISDVSVVSWVQRCTTDRLALVVVASTINDAVLYVDSRPKASVSLQDAMRYVADGALPASLIDSDRTDS